MAKLQIKKLEGTKLTAKQMAKVMTSDCVIHITPNFVEDTITILFTDMTTVEVR